MVGRFNNLYNHVSEQGHERGAIIVEGCIDDATKASYLELLNVAYV